MNEQQLRELIRLASQAALLFSVTRQFIGGKKPEQGDATDSKPTGLRRFLPWGRSSTDSEGADRGVQLPEREPELDSAEYAQQRVDDIIRSMIPDFEPAVESEADLKSVIAGATSDESRVASGTTVQIAPEANPAGEAIGPNRSPDRSDEADPSREFAERRVDEIIRSVLADRDSQGNGTEQSDSDASFSLKSLISGAVERQDAIQAGQQPTVEQSQVPGIISAKPGESKDELATEPSRMSNLADSFQLGLDVVGAFDPTPIADGVNAAISLGRAFVTDPERRKEHLQNAAISAVSMVPYVGDTAKLAKVPRAAKTVQRTSQMVRGADRVTGTAKAATAAEKRAARASYRETTEKVLGSGSSTEDTSAEGAGSEPRGAPVVGGGSQPPGDRPPVMSSGPGPEDNPGSRGLSEEAAGIEEYKSWSEKIKDSGKKLLEFAGFLGKAGVIASAFVKGLNLLNTGVLALNRDLAAYNGQIAGAYARADAADIRRDMRRSQALSGPLSGLSDEQTELKNTISSLTIPMQQIGVGILEKTTSLVNWTVRVTGIIEPAVSALEWLASFFGRQEDANQATAWMTFFQDVSDGKFDGQRPRFIGGRRQILDDPDHKEVFGP